MDNPNKAPLDNPNEAPRVAVARRPIQPRPCRQQPTVVIPAPPIHGLPFSIDPPYDDPPSPWRQSRAKKALYHDMVTGVTARYSGPTQVFFSRLIYQRYNKENFCSNYRALKRATDQCVGAAAAARAALDHDLPILIARRQGQVWRGSAAQIQLQRDVIAGRMDGKTPRQVFYANNRAIYRQNGMTLSKLCCLTLRR